MAFLTSYTKRVTKPWHTGGAQNNNFGAVSQKDQKFSYVVCGKGYKEHRKGTSWALVHVLQSFFYSFVNSARLFYYLCIL